MKKHPISKYVQIYISKSYKKVKEHPISPRGIK